MAKPVSITTAGGTNRQRAGKRIHKGGEKPGMATSNAYGDPGPELRPEQNARKPGRINLKTVAVVLAEMGMDPTVELVKVLQSGKLDPKTASSVNLALIEYCQPKLKSIDHKHEVNLTPDQMDARLRALLEKAGVPADMAPKIA